MNRSRCWSTSSILALLLAGCADPSGQAASVPEHANPRGALPLSSAAPPAPAATADERIQWQTWEAAAFETARQQDRLVLLFMMAPWAGPDPFAKPESALRALVQERYVPIVVDPLRRPDIARRYGPAGWPALAVTLSDGRLVAIATDIPRANIHKYLLSLANHYRDRRQEVERRVNAFRPLSHGSGSRSPVSAAALYDDVVAAYDAVQGGFGTGVKFPETSVVHFLLSYYDHQRDEEALAIALRNLEILSSAPMWEEERGGVLSYSFTSDWLSPIMEKDGADQAGLLRALLYAGQLTGELSSAPVSGLLAYIRGQLFNAETGAFYSRQVQRNQGGQQPAWWTDPTVYTDKHALLVMACLSAGWVEVHGSAAVEMGLAGADYMSQRCVRADGAVYHYVTESGPRVPGLLDDQMLAARALWEAYRVSGREQFAAATRRIVAWTETNLYDAQERAFTDRVADAAVPSWQPAIRFTDLEVPSGNATAAALYLLMGQQDKTSNLLEGRMFDSPAVPRRAHATHGISLMRWQSMMEGAQQ